MSFLNGVSVYSLCLCDYITSGVLRMIRSELIQIIADENPPLSA